MSDKELEVYIDAIEEGLKESHKKLLHDYALHNDSLIVGDGNGNVVHVPAREILERHPELRM